LKVEANAVLSSQKNSEALIPSPMRHLFEESVADLTEILNQVQKDEPSVGIFGTTFRTVDQVVGNS
jgi:hypothetical protein